MMMALAARYEVMTQEVSSTLVESEPCMCGRATLVMLVSSIWVTVISITERVIEGVATGVLGAILTDEERRIIHRWFGEHPDAVRTKALPPGIRKKLARGGAMPPGIAMQVMPDGLYRQLPRRYGHHYEIVGTDVVLVDTATRIIVDVLKDVLRGG